ncbi:ferredoxin [Symbioplanes lichenis]|uniref:ferredoxin n=1 Tax=Symbioplanes lichenis TaxID=1629072 RepID=UPI00273A50F3|nr:ferredoxin [Actinoplanes lichenis]
MRLHVDWTACDGRGLCAELLPELITEDEWGYPVVRTDEVSPRLEKAAGRAVDRCPALALHLLRR